MSLTPIKINSTNICKVSNWTEDNIEHLFYVWAKEKKWPEDNDMETKFLAKCSLNELWESNTSTEFYLLFVLAFPGTYSS